MSSKKEIKKIWLDEGLKILETKGPSMLSIENLTVRIKKTKGSFYHHFNNRENYIKNLLEHYENISTIEVQQVTDSVKIPHETLKTLTKLAFKLSGKLELAIRAWALYDPMVKNFQNRIDRSRLAHIKELHMNSGMNPDAAEIRSYRDYSLFLGLQQIRYDFNDNDFHILLKNLFSN